MARPDRAIDDQQRLGLRTPVSALPGVTPERLIQLERLGINTVTDVLFFFPRDYHDLTNVRPIDQLVEGELVSVLGTVVDVDARKLRSGRTLVAVLIEQEGRTLRGLWFNQAFMREKFTIGQRVMLSGKPKRHGPRWEMNHPRVQWLADEEEEAATGFVPIYPLTEGLKQRHVRRIVRIALDRYGKLVEETFPQSFLDSHGLWPIQQALPQVHFPSDAVSLEAARKRFVYQELFILQLALAVKRKQLQDQQKAPPMPATAKIDSRIRRLFPFDLTAGQTQAVAEVAADMARTWPMNRLLQGDVGSGKTIVAAYAMLLAVAHGYQAVLMAPTEVLARQHAATLERMLSESQVRRGLLTGGLADSARERLLAQIAAGEIDIVIGTQAVVHDSVEFARLGLVVIDEQHKFGVRQRAVLKDRGRSTPSNSADPLKQNGQQDATPALSKLEAPQLPKHQQALFTAPVVPRLELDPHYLVMTATPIPRTLTLTLFGDLDVSTLRDCPPGRQKVQTYLVEPDKRERWWQFFRKKLDQGRQGYVVAPLVEESDEIAAQSLNACYESLTHGELATYRLGLIHGRMTPTEKHAVMDDFRQGEIQVLVSTTVIEVGVDIPNATLMTIEGGERFGLSQLHQLRGRISRGAHPGFCGVFAEAQSEESQERLKAFVATTDGFKLAEADFAIRGPGNMLGTRQHGMPPLRIADLVRDAEALQEARAAAGKLVESDPGLSSREHARLRRMVLARYGRVLNLGDVG